MSTSDALGRRPRRHALGLPPGSVRALLALGVLALMWGMTLLGQPDPETHKHKMPMAFIYLQLLTLLIIGSYFSAHGKTIGHVPGNSALGLPPFTVRILLIVGYAGLGYFLWWRQSNFAYDIPPYGSVALMVGLLVSGFVLGRIATATMTFLGGGESPAWYQDVEAWFSLLALLCMGILFVVYVFINPSLSGAERLDMRYIESALAAIVGYYFGARS